MKKLGLFIAVLGIIGLSFAPNSVVEDGKSGSGKASWYGPRFHGKLTANGETYNMNKLTAAHKTLRFGTKVEVTNPKNNKSVVVRVNDRGPYVKGRVFDLSKAAFNKIGNTNSGVIRIEYEILGK